MKKLAVIVSCLLLAVACGSRHPVELPDASSVDASAPVAQAAPHRVGMDYPTVGGDLSGTTNNAGIQSISGTNGAGGTVTAIASTLSFSQASTVKTTVGNFAVDSAATLNLGTTNATTVNVGSAATATSVTLDATTSVAVLIGGSSVTTTSASGSHPSIDVTYSSGLSNQRWSEVYTTGVSAGSSANGLSLTTSELSSTTNGTIGLGDNTHAFSGLYAQLLGGSTTVPLAWAATAGAIACGTGGTQTVSAAQAATPGLSVTTGTLSSDCILDFGTNAVTGWYLVDINGITLGAFHLSFKNGTTTQSLTTALIPAGGLVLVWTHGANKIAIN